MMQFDSIIFDMDGTLWDAVSSYAHVWNATLADLGYDHAPVTRDQLIACMGMPLDQILDKLLMMHEPEKSRFLKQLAVNEACMMPLLGGTLYPGVMDGIKRLAEVYKLFMVSNCSASGLPNFLSFTTLEPYFTDTLSNGETGLSKADNILEIARRNNLVAPLYVGDTQGDADQCRQAEVPFMYVSYGFGDCKDPDLMADSFDQLVDILLNP